MPRGIKKALTMRHLQANDAMPSNHTPLGVPENFLTEEEINEISAPYVAKGVKLKITDDHWFMTLVKQVRNQKGSVIGEGPITIQGTRKMPMRDLVQAADDFMIPLSPITPNKGV